MSATRFAKPSWLSDGHGDTFLNTCPGERCVSTVLHVVKRRQSGEMALRWTVVGIFEAERQFRRIIGYRDLAKLAVAIERDLARTTVPSPTEEVAILVTA